MRAWWKVALPVVVVLVYAPSLHGTLLNYDDDWVIGRNTIAAAPMGVALPRIWGDWSAETRQTLCNEYLPMRDTSFWLGVHVLGGSAFVLRAMNLAIYVVALLLLRGALRRMFPRDGAVAELALWLYALHPTHAESVAWVAGCKDVLALLFVSAAMLVHVRDRPRGVVGVPLLLGLAMLSKSVAIVGPLLLPLTDLARRRRVAWPTVLASLAVVAPIFLVQLHASHLMTHNHELLGGDRLTAAASMGPVFARYVAHSFLPFGLSVAYDDRVVAAASPRAWIGYLPLVLWGLAGVWAWRARDRRAPLLAAAWFVLSLAPTSQVLVPLDNVDADRYLLLAVLGPCALLALALTGLARRATAREPPASLLGRRPEALAAPAVVFFGVLAMGRGLVFSDSVSLWRDAVAKTETRGLAAYKLGEALDAAGDRDGARRAFLESVRRLPATQEDPTDYVARLLIARGQVDAATVLLRKGVGHLPQSAKLLRDLAGLLADSSDPERETEGRQLFEAFVRRFPDDPSGRRDFEARYGPLP